MVMMMKKSPTSRTVIRERSACHGARPPVTAPRLAYQIIVEPVGGAGPAPAEEEAPPYPFFDMMMIITITMSSSPSGRPVDDDDDDPPDHCKTRGRCQTTARRGRGTRIPGSARARGPACGSSAQSAPEPWAALTSRSCCARTACTGKQNSAYEALMMVMMVVMVVMMTRSCCAKTAQRTHKGGGW
jgi:hypothetical protein